ncbi:glucose/arabinose dehydrogenase [Diaminobutyricimonas aerilata]|uniref:Glucose/arabinose dehydrogenase n=1 Tax=Diaminobutyricimonas aerilata TaxID=1162967 RepID=A0A2M9CN26_9MICO|nr:PQQ-dependent sugar dehydrogenase [Diaminobutyricimonas aerilata]PJJ73309.1 glucose/arabinose dehydrogenase [Diaminobutyricimonas aerilata]
MDRRPFLLALSTASVLALAACAAPVTGDPEPVPTGASSATEQPSAGPVQPVGEPEVVAEGFDVPWSVVPLGDGGALVSERGTALVKQVLPDGSVREVAQVPGVEPAGEGGLLGLARLDDGDSVWLYAYLTAASDNRVVRMPLTGDPARLALGEPEVVLEGIAKNSTHNGGRIAFGPDGMLYVTAGDAQQRDAAQDPASLSGKILRIAPDGTVPADNPFPGSAVYSIGHRNPQGIAWDDGGQLWAAEFGQNTWDEFNVIRPGANYGWPVVEGIGDDPAYVNPVYQWSTSEASPSGLAFVDGTFFLAALRGQRVWAIYTDTGEASAVPWFEGEFGRIRDVTRGPDGALWFLTNDTGNDRLMRVGLGPLQEG